MPRKHWVKHSQSDEEELCFNKLAVTEEESGEEGPGTQSVLLKDNLERVVDSDSPSKPMWSPTTRFRVFLSRRRRIRL